MPKRKRSVYIPSFCHLKEQYQEERGTLNRPLWSLRCRYERFERPSSNYYVIVRLYIYVSTDGHSGDCIFKDAVQVNAFEAHLHSY